MAKQLWGEDHVAIEHPDGALWSVPVSWTDFIPADPYVSIGRGRARFRVGDLVQLTALVATLGPR